MKRAFAMILTLVMVLSLVACGGGKDEPEAGKTDDPAAPSTSEAAGYEENVIIGFNEDLSSADPYANTVTATHTFTNSTFNTLIYVDPYTTEVMPELAKSWSDVSEAGDGSVWELELVDATFHDGSKFTSEDVKFTWEYITDVANVVKVFSGAQVTAVEEIECVDENTVRFHLNKPFPDFVSYLEIKIYSKTAFDSMSKEEAAVIGTGPYYFNKDMTQSGVQFVGTRYDDYWGGAENYPTKNLIFTYQPTTDTAIAALQAGELDIVPNLAPSQVSVVESDSALKLYATQGSFSYYIGYNYRNPIWQDVRMRKAIGLAVDKDAVVDVAYNGGVGGSVSYNFCAPTGLGHDPSISCDKYDVEAAKALLKECGKEGMSLTIAYPALEVNKAMCEVIQSCLSSIGINVTLVSHDTTNWTSVKAGDEYDLFVDTCGYQGALLYNFDRFFYTGGSSNLYGYSSAEYEALQDAVAAETTWDGMLEQFGVLQAWVAENVPIFPLCYNKMLHAATTDLEQVDPCLSLNLNYCDFSYLCVPSRG